MKKLLIIAAALGLVACVSKAPQQPFANPTNVQNVPINMNTNIPLVAYSYETEVTAMSRHQVIEATHLCEDAGLKATPVMARRRITGQTTEVIVEIICTPKYQR